MGGILDALKHFSSYELEIWGEYFKFGQQDTCLKCIQTAVDPDPDIVILMMAFAVDPDGFHNFT